VCKGHSLQKISRVLKCGSQIYLKIQKIRNVIKGKIEGEHAW